MNWPLTAAARLVTAWTRLYTGGLPAPVRDRRRAEIGADVHGQLDEARSRRERPAMTAALLVSRLMRGALDDLSWRHEVGRPVILARWQTRRGPLVAAVLAITAVACLGWFGGGLSLRNGGNQAPLRIAASASARLSSGSTPGSVLPPTVDMASSLAPFVIVYGANGRVLASSGRLGGGTPPLPAGVFAWVAAHGQDRITWQPAAGVREAAVIERYAGPRPGFVLAAQSLRGVTGQQLSLALLIACLWLAALAVSLLVIRYLPGRRTTPQRS